MQEIVWNHTDHMLPCIELHGNLMNLDPGSLNLRVLSKLEFLVQVISKQFKVRT